jgi:hypothetical protein
VGEGGRIRDEIILEASQTKGNRARRVFINAKLKKELGSHIRSSCRDGKPSDPLFRSQKRRAFNANTMCQLFLGIYKSCGIRGASRTVEGARLSQIWRASRYQFVFSQFWVGTAQFRRRSYTLTAMISSCGTPWSWLDCREQWGRVSSAVPKSCPLCPNSDQNVAVPRLSALISRLNRSTQHIIVEEKDI